MFIMVGTLMVRALRPLAKDHKELEHVEPEVTGLPWVIGEKAWKMNVNKNRFLGKIMS